MMIIINVFKINKLNKKIILYNYTYSKLY
jgi:hypothetical protein